MTRARNNAIARAIALGGGSQAALAQRVGCSQQTISRLLNGEISVNSGIALRLANATHGKVSLAELIPKVVEAVAAELGVTISLPCSDQEGHII